MSNRGPENAAWPFEMNYLPEAFLEKAERELNESLENRMTCLHDLKKLIESTYFFFKKQMVLLRIMTKTFAPFSWEKHYIPFTTNTFGLAMSFGFLSIRHNSSNF